MGKKKKVCAALLGVTLLSGVMAGPASAEVKTPTLASVTAEAKKEVPKDSVLLKTELEDGRYEFSFMDKDKAVYYDLEYSAATGALLEYEMDQIGASGSKTVTLSGTEIRGLAGKRYPKATIQSVNLEKDDGLSEYTVFLNTAAFSAKLVYHPETGALMEEKLDYQKTGINGQAQKPGNAAQAAQAALKEVPKDSILLDTEWEDGLYRAEFLSADKTAVYEVTVALANSQVLKIEMELVYDQGGNTVTLSKEDARKKLTAAYPGAVVDECKLEWDDGKAVYKMAFHTDAYAGEAKVHPENGQLLKVELKRSQKQNGASGNGASGNGQMTFAEAQALLLKKLPGGTVVKLELDEDDGVLVYEGEMRKNGAEYEFKIHAATGAFLQWEIDD